MIAAVYVVIDVGCHECGVSSVPVGIYTTAEGAAKAHEARDTETKGWRDGGQTFCVTFEMALPTKDTP